MSSGRLLSLSSPIACPRLQCRPPALAPVYRAGPITAPAVPLRLIFPALPVAGVPSMRIKQASKRRAGVICYAAPLRPHTLQWVSAASMAVLMFAKGTAIHKSFLLPLFVLQAPSSVISWIKGDYGTWTAFLALLVRIFYYLAGVLYVRPDMDEGYGKKDYSYSDPFPVNRLKPDECSSSFSSFSKNNEYWLVRMDKPGVEVVSKAQMVDYYAQALTKVLGNEKDAQVSIYHISWEKDFGFCCQIDYECARELVDVPGVLSVQTDLNHESETKNYKGNDSNLSEAEVKQVPNIRTKRLFVTGLSFYTSEKTLRAAFEGFGELIEVKIIMDKISKRSKGYAFIEYTTEEAASAALKEMNGKIINGWMIVVDVAKTNPPRYNRGQPRPSQSSTSSSY